MDDCSYAMEACEWESIFASLFLEQEAGISTWQGDFAEPEPTAHTATESTTPGTTSGLPFDPNLASTRLQTSTTHSESSTKARAGKVSNSTPTLSSNVANTSDGSFESSDYNQDTPSTIHHLLSDVLPDNPAPVVSTKKKKKKRDPRLECPNFLAGRIPCSCPEEDELDEDIEAQDVVKKRSKVGALCQVPSCGGDISHLKGYHQRHRVCLECANSPQVLLKGQPHRYCQQCGKFHRLSDFDEGKRSCRRKLERHNRRRRRRPLEEGEEEEAQDVGVHVREIENDNITVDSSTQGIRQVEGSLNSAKLTVLLLRQVVSQHRMPHSGQASTLIAAVKAVGTRLIAASPIELAVGNVVRRVLHIIREEEVSVAISTEAELEAGSDSDDNSDSDNDGPPGLSAAVLAAANRSVLRAPSLHNLLESVFVSSAAVVPSSSGGDSEGKSRSCEKNSKGWKLKHSVIEGINELLDDIENNHAQIAEQALEHIHQDEVILTLGHSRTLFQFLCEAKKKRSFQVFIAEGAPRYQGHTLAKELAALNLQTTVITDSAVFAMISRVDMVIIGAHAVMANGGVIAPTGLHMVALAARRHAVPFVVLAGMYKLCPLYPHNPYVLVNEMKSPSQVLDFEDMLEYVDEGLGGPLLHETNPSFDYIPPELVSLFITDMGGHNPSYIYRLVAEYYSPEDFSLE